MNPYVYTHFYEFCRFSWFISWFHILWFYFPFLILLKTQFRVCIDFLNWYAFMIPCYNSMIYDLDSTSRSYVQYWFKLPWVCFSFILFFSPFVLDMVTFLAIKSRDLEDFLVKDHLCLTLIYFYFNFLGAYIFWFEVF
jgi:hypothetical protein